MKNRVVESIADSIPAELESYSKEMTVYSNSIFPTNPGQKLKVASVKNENNIFNEVKYVSIFIEKQKLQDFSKVVFNKSELCFKNDNNPIDYSLLEAIRLF